MKMYDNEYDTKEDKIIQPGIKLNHNNNDIQLCIVIMYTTVFLLVLKEILKFYSRTLF